MLPQAPHLPSFIHFEGKRDLPHLGLVVMLVAGIVLGVYLALQPQIFNKKASEGSLVDLKFAPETIQIQRGKKYEAKIAINPKGQRVTAMQVFLGYDPAVVTILEVKNEGFLPINLKTEDDFKGVLNLTYASTVESQANQPAMVATLHFKVLDSKASEIVIKSDSQVGVSSQEGNALTSYSVLKLEPISVEAVQDPSIPVQQGSENYQDDLLLEKAFIPASSPFVRDFTEAITPKPEIKPERLEPQFSEAYLKQLGKDIFIEPVVALNDVIQDKAEEIINP